MKLGILTPTIVGREALLERMATELDRQIGLLPKEDQAFHIINKDNKESTTGHKRNELIQSALLLECDYIAFFDDDDLPSDCYIEKVFEGMRSGADCCELWGQIYWSGKSGKPFHHSIIHKEWWEDDKFYYRMPNHLNAIKLSLIKDIKFPDQVFGEDGQWSYAIRDAGVLKTEFKISETLYHYFCGEPKHVL